MKITKRALAFLLCVCLLAGMTVVSSAADETDAVYREWFTQIDGVRLDGAPYLSAIDFSAVVKDTATLSGQTLRLYRTWSPNQPIKQFPAADSAVTRDDLENMEWVANFVFSEQDVGVATLDAYPGAQALVRCDCAVYTLAATEGVLFDDTELFSFTPKAYFQNAFTEEDGTYLQTCICWGNSQVSWFSDCAVTKAEGETVYEMELTLNRIYRDFFDAFDPEAEIVICGQSFASFLRIQARPIAFDTENGVLTIELCGADGSPGATMFGLRLFDNNEFYDFELLCRSGLLSCGAAQMGSASLTIHPADADGMPMRVWADREIAHYAYRYAQNIQSEEKIRSFFYFVRYVTLLPMLFTDGILMLDDAAQALGGNLRDNIMSCLSALLSSFGRMLKNI